MGPVRDDEHDRPSESYRRTKSAARLFNELVERVSPDASSDKAKSPPFANEDGLLPDTTSSPPPIDAPNFAHTTSNSKDTSSNLPQHIFESLKSQYNQHQPHDPSPTDSHPRNHHTRRRSSRSSETISTMLLLAAERLAQETSRANEAERQSSEVLAHFKIAHHAKQRLEIDLQRANNELVLYKTQLDVAQAEIRRAQEVVDKIDRQRADAEDEARRGRDKVRKLTEVRSIESAMEEGRRLGYEEGMKQGRRLMMQARDSESNQPSRYSRRTSVRTSSRDDVDDDDQVTYFSYTQEEWQSSDSFRSSSEPSTSVRSLSRRRRTSDARHAANPIPPVSTTPPTRQNPIPSSTQPNDDANQPENIAVRPHPAKDTSLTQPIRPISAQNHSPTVSHRSFKLPPDGYIPTMDANSVISLPPPHELSMPVAPTSASQPSATAKRERKKTSTSRSSEHADRESRKRTPQSVDGDSTSHYSLSRQHHTNNRHKEPAYTRPRSEASRASTYISQSSLLGPPDSNNIGKKESNEDEDYFTAGARRIWTPSQASTQFKRIPSKRRVNPDRMPPSPSPAQSSLNSYNETTHGNFIIERPSSTNPTKRRPREIVPSTPLTGFLLNSSTVQKPSGASQEAVHQWRNDIDGPSSQDYHNPRPQYVHESISQTKVPGIEIVTPSTTTLSTLSARTVINPGLLSPESARSTPLQPTTEVPRTTGLGLYSNPPLSMSMLGDEQRITMVLPDNNLPPGFIPLSPIPGMKNLDSYPSGFAPSMSKLQDEYPGGQLPSNFSYPSSPRVYKDVPAQ